MCMDLEFIEEVQLELQLDIINPWHERWPVESVSGGSKRVRGEKDQEVSLRLFQILENERKRD